jgi:hypothetical protein
VPQHNVVSQAKAKRLGLPIHKRMAATLFSKKAKRYGWGAKKGWDAADLIDAPLRVAKGLSIPFFDIKNSLLRFALDAGNKLSEVSGEQITSKNIEQKKKERGGLEGVGIFTPDLEEAKFIRDRGSHYNTGTDNIQLDPRRYSKTGKKLFGESQGVSPITMYEEMAHARGGKLHDKTNAFRDKMMKGGALSKWAAKIPEELRAKGVALKDVAKHEGLIEAALSIPSLAASVSSYVLPSSEFTRSQSIQTEYRKKLQESEREYNSPKFTKDQANRMLGLLDKEMIDKSWEDSSSYGHGNKTRTLKWMAESGNPINELKAYFGAKPKSKIKRQHNDNIRKWLGHKKDGKNKKS